LSKGSGPYSNPKKPSWAALLSPQPDQFAVIDNRTVITGSFNWSPSAAHQNDEVLLVIESPLLAAHFTREMDRLWRGAEQINFCTVYVLILTIIAIKRR